MAIVVDAVDDNHVFLATGYCQASLVQKPQISGSEPSVVSEDFLVEGGILIVARSDRETLDLQTANRVLADYLVLSIHNAQGSFGKGTSDFHKWVVICSRVQREAIRVNHARRRLGHSPDREHCSGRKSVRAKQFQEPSRCSSNNGLACVYDKSHRG